MQFHYGMAAYMMGATEEARRALQKAADSPADFSGKEEAQARLSMLAASEKGKERLSVAQLQDRLKEHPDDIMVLVQLGGLLAEQGEFSEAATNIREGVPNQPESSRPRAEARAIVRRSAERPDESARLCKKSAGTCAP